MIYIKQLSLVDRVLFGGFDSLLGGLPNSLSYAEQCFKQLTSKISLANCNGWMITALGVTPQALLVSSYYPCTLKVVDRRIF